jgi:cold shock CspA family protein
MPRNGCRGERRRSARQSAKRSESLTPRTKEEVTSDRQTTARTEQKENNMQGKIIFCNPQRGFLVLSVTNPDFTVQKYFAWLSAIEYQETPDLQVGYAVEFEVSHKLPKKPTDYRFAENVKVFAPKHALIEGGQRGLAGKVHFEEAK